MSKSEINQLLHYHTQELIKEYNAIETPMKQKIESNVYRKETDACSLLYLGEEYKSSFFVIEPKYNQNSFHSLKATRITSTKLEPCLNKRHFLEPKLNR